MVRYGLNVMDLKTGQCETETFQDAGEDAEQGIVAYLGSIDGWITIIVQVPEWYGGREDRFYFQYQNGLLLPGKPGRM